MDIYECRHYRPYPTSVFTEDIDSSDHKLDVGIRT